MATTAAKKKTTSKKATDDLIVNVSHEVENYDKTKAFVTVKTLAEDIEFSYFKVGGILNRINEEGWYTEEGFTKFSEFVEAEFGIKRTKAMYLINIYNGLLTSGVAWEDVKDVGWSKLKEIVSVLTKKNVGQWVKRANEMTVLQLNAYVKQHKAGESGGSGEDDSGVPKVSSMTFKMHDDQKEVVTEALDKAKDESKTEHNNVALEAICMDYLAGPSKPTTATEGKDTITEETEVEATLDVLKAMMENFNYIQVLETFELVWPDIDVTVAEPD